MFGGDGPIDQVAVVKEGELLDHVGKSQPFELLALGQRKEVADRPLRPPLHMLRGGLERLDAVEYIAVFEDAATPRGSSTDVELPEGTAQSGQRCASENDLREVAPAAKRPYRQHGRKPKASLADMRTEIPLRAT
jgi:hypothetical protein